MLVGNDFAIIDETAKPSADTKPEEKKEPKPEEKKPEPVKEAPKAEEKPKEQPKAAPAPKPAPKIEIPVSMGTREVRRVPIGKLREATAERLKEAQSIYAMLTTFNECDMSAITSLRKDLGPAFKKKYGAELSYMSAFVKASTMSLQKYPAINAVIEGKNVVYHDFADVSIEISTPKGVLVPVLRNCESLSFGDIERVITYIIIEHRRSFRPCSRGKSGS